MPEKPADPNQIELEERQKAKVVEESVRNEVQGTLKRPEGVHLAPTK